MKSCIYEGKVGHCRHKPFQHSFRYSVFFLYLDLSELDTVFRGRWLWSTDHFNIAYLRRKDHFGDPSIPLDTAVRDLVYEKTGRRPDGPIRMLAHLRYFGHNFNPASFYYCYDKEDRHVEAIIVEIHNTPWGEVFCYVLDETDNQGTEKEKRFRLRKVFHVSPFIDMTMDYEWTFTEPGRKLTVHMIDWEKDENFFEANLALCRKEMTGLYLALMLVKYPVVTVKVIAGIYWQAFRLWIKGAKFYAHPAKKRKEGA